MELLVTFIPKLLCPLCRQPLGGNKRLSDVTEHRTNQAGKIVFTCQRQHKEELFTSKKCGKVYETNRRFPLAIFSLGKNEKGAERFLGNMNMPPPPYKKSWEDHKKQILKATQSGRNKSMEEVCRNKSMEEAVQELTDAQGTDVTVSVDGTWQRRGFSSKNGIVTALSVNRKKCKVIDTDTETLANYCDACAKKKNKASAEDFALWHTEHTESGKCEKNHTGSAPSMEPEGAKRIFRRSEEKNHLRYIKYLGDGDSKSYSRVKNADPPIYEGTLIEKLECCGHVQKRMGRQLMNKVSALKTTMFNHNGKQVKGIGGRNGLKKSQQFS